MPPRVAPARLWWTNVRVGWFVPSGRAHLVACDVARRDESPHNNRMSGHQLDLFSAAGVGPVAAADDGRRQPVCAASLSDAGLLEAIPHARQSDCDGLTGEAVRRGLPAVPALEALCRRFKGFGLHSVVPEQISALRALADIRGNDAAAAVGRLIVAEVVQGPGLVQAACAAATLGCRLPEDAAVPLLRHADPTVRASACRCAPNTGRVADVLFDLLWDLHEPVATAAACALGRFGRREARPPLLQRLQTAPCAETIKAVARVADDDIVVLLGRLARAHPTLREAAVAALEDIDTPRAADVLAGLRAGRD